MKPIVENQKLPNEIEAHSFVCRCLGIGRDELDRTLVRLRKITPQPEEHFPAKIWRETVKRAKGGENRWGKATKVIHDEAAYDRIRRQRGEPLWSFTGKLTDELISTLISLYARLLPKLDLQNVPTKDALWGLVTDAFIPTAYIKLVTEWREGLGNEFLDESCWYLPIKSREGVQKPVPRMLKYWMRVAGFQTAFQVAKAAGKSSLRRKIDRWLKGEIVPDPIDLHKLVDKFAAEVCWLDDRDTWKARFTLACAMQNVCDLMDEYFEPVKKDSSLTLIELLRGASKDRIVCAGNQFLSGAHSFFAARLLQQRLQAEKKWNPNLANQAAWFHEIIWKMAVTDGCIKDGHSSTEAFFLLEQYLFDVGVRELNRLLDAKRKKGRRENSRRL